MSKEDILNEYLVQFPNLPNSTLAKKIYNENELLFKNLEAVRHMIRHRRGAEGKNKLLFLKDTTFLPAQKLKEKYNLPDSIETEYVPYKIIGNKGLIFSDTHIPFHNISAISTMFDYTIKKDFDFILILGDFLDCFDISVFAHEPDKSKMQKEREKGKIFLQELKRLYPKARIYLKFGNHEKRFELYLMNKAPEIFGMPEFRLEILLDLYNMKIEYIPETHYIDLGGLYAIHGHEYKKAVISPANPARTFYLRTKDCTIGAHYHQTSEHTEASINDKMVACWSLGCLCQLHPEFMPLNRWNHGFAIYERYDDNFWRIDNKKIVEGRVV